MNNQNNNNQTQAQTKTVQCAHCMKRIEIKGAVAPICASCHGFYSKNRRKLEHRAFYRGVKEYGR